MRSYNPEERKRFWKPGCKGRERKIIRGAQKYFLESEPAPPLVLWTGKATEPILWTTRKDGRSLLGEDVEEGDITVVPEMLRKRPRRELVLALKGAATEKANTSKPMKPEKEITQKSKKTLPTNKPPYGKIGSSSGPVRIEGFIWGDAKQKDCGELRQQEALITGNLCVWIFVSAYDIDWKTITRLYFLLRQTWGTLEA